MTPASEMHVLTVDSWRELARTDFLKLDCQTSHAGFQGKALVSRFGSGLAAEMNVSASRVLRRRRDAENSPVPFFKAFWQLAGTSEIEQGSRQSRLQPGMWSLYDTSREYSITSSDRSRFMVLLIPQAECADWVSSVQTISGMALDGRGAPAIVMSTLAGMLRDGSYLDPESQALLHESTMTLLERALHNEAGRFGAAPKAEQLNRLERVQAYIQQHLGDPLLNPERVAREFAMSRRSLYNLFITVQNTPSAFIQQARLERARSLLVHPAWRERSAAQISLDCGFTDPAHFSRAFNNRYGIPPATWRERHH